MAASNDTVSARKPQSGAEFDGGAAGPSIDPADVARFSAQAAEWWDARGPFAPLHKFNPARLAFVRDRAAERFGRDVKARAAFDGLTLLDVGCGGGLIAEPMRRLGFAVTAVDASSENIGTARAHAAQQGLDIAYRAATVEQLEAEGAGPFDVVLTLEVIEHVADPEAFIRACSRLVKPAEGSGPRQGGGRIHPALGAGGNARLEPVLEAGRDPDDAVARACGGQRTVRPGL
jgi:2-polyprenyl-6-hydroxyphenyl methylase/3-demethylubiquinone-9 3-methyltransferase